MTTQVEMVAAPIPLGLYVHVPWCVRKCPYCDFNSHPLRRPVFFYSGNALNYVF